MTQRAGLSWQQIRTLATASIRSRYRNTYAGMFWVLLSPLLMYAAQGFAFKYVLKIQFENYPLFLLTGLLPWVFFISSLTMCTGQIINQGRMFKSFPVHPIAYVTSTILDNFINFIVAFLFILVPVVAFSANVNLLNLFWLPLPMLSLIIATIGGAVFLATQQVFFHDTRFLVEFGASVAFYITPIFYPSQFVGPELKWLVKYNPLAILIQPFQDLSRHDLPSTFFFEIALSYFVSLAFMAGALAFWRKKQNMLYFNL